MVAIPFDTLKFADKLEAGGFSAQQARAAAEAFAEATGQELATKSDIVHLEGLIRESELRMTIKIGAMQAVLVAIVAALLKMH